jgi:hypothetical protein
MRELTYQMPYERLAKLGKTMGRKAFRGIWWRKWAFFAIFLAITLGISGFGDRLDRWASMHGVPVGSGTLLLAAFGLLAAGVFWLRRTHKREMKSRADYDQQIRLSKDEGGLHFATNEIEYYLKWPGISQMLMDRDGVVVSHGGIFFMVPDRAFESEDERGAFIRDVYGRLKPEAQALSREYMEPFLKSA